MLHRISIQCVTEFKKTDCVNWISQHILFSIFTNFYQIGQVHQNQNFFDKN